MIRFIFLCAFLVSYTFAQDSTDLSWESKYKVAYKIPLTSWLDFTSPSYNFGIEVRHKEKFGMHYELGYINNRFNFVYNRAFPRNFQGFKAIVAPKIYFSNQEKVSLYIAPTLFYKFYSEKMEDEEFSRFGGQYFQKFDYNRNIHMFSFSPKFGVFFLKEGSFVGFDVSAGFGFRVQHISTGSSIPEDAQSTAFNPFNLRRDAGTYVRPNAYISIAVLFVKRKNKVKKEQD